MASATNWSKRYVKPPRELMQDREQVIAIIRLNDKAKYLERFSKVKLKEYNQMTSLGLFAPGIIHDLSSPLTTVSLNLGVLSDQIGKNQSLDLALEGVNKMGTIIQNFRNSSKDVQNGEIFNVYKEIQNNTKLVEYKVETDNINLLIGGNKKVNIHTNKAKFNQVLLNLVTNALDSFDNINRKNKKILIKISSYKNHVKITVKDNGQGMSSETLRRAFSPFFTTKPKDTGLGLGLFICKKTVENDFKGKLSIESRLNKYTTVTISIPK